MVRVYNNSPTKQPIGLRAKAGSKDFVISEQQISLKYNKHIDIEEKYLDMSQLENLRRMGFVSFSII